MKFKWSFSKKKAMKIFKTMKPSVLADITAEVAQCDHTLFVFACGYEARSIALAEKILSSASNGNWTLCGFSFNTYRNFGSRPNNEKILQDYGFKCIEMDGKDAELFILNIKQHLIDLGNNFTQLRIVIDYSSMPRSWYCRLMLECLKKDWMLAVDWVYVSGNYPEFDYPCVGYGEFNRFSGQPGVDRTQLVHFFGLGLDSIRTHGIWNHLDPQCSWCFIAASKRNRDLVRQVHERNTEIIAGSIEVSEVAVDNFTEILATLSDAVRKASAQGDVALVPDGPKPLILAMSIIPTLLELPGVFCWHVGHVKPDGYVPVDVSATGTYYGFRIMS